MWGISDAAILLGLLGAREITRGIRYSQLSGFRFYLVNGLVEGISYLLALPLIFVIPNYSVGIIVGAILLSTVLGFWQTNESTKLSGLTRQSGKSGTI